MNEPKLWYPAMRPPTRLFLRLMQKEGEPVALWLVDEEGSRVAAVAVIGRDGRMSLPVIPARLASQAGLTLSGQGCIALARHEAPTPT